MSSPYTNVDKLVDLTYASTKAEAKVLVWSFSGGLTAKDISGKLYSCLFHHSRILRLLYIYIVYSNSHIYIYRVLYAYVLIYIYHRYAELRDLLYH